jgi:ATP/maltotriose-dependent transcriptional regulator MalT
MQLLKTKLHVPPIQQDLVARPALMERLSAGLHRKLTLVSVTVPEASTELEGNKADG